MVDIHSTRYAIARRYMIRLRRDDFEREETLARIAGATNPPMTTEAFRQAFQHLVADEQPALDLLHN